MTVNDPIADMLTRVRNAVMSGQAMTAMPFSKVKLEIAKILKEEGYILNFKMAEDDKQGVLRVDLKYTAEGRPVIDGLKRESRPGRRVYLGKEDIKPVLGGLGVAILSTPRGVVTDRAAKREGVGGELLCTVW
jgi:small subunit ribosomal protein S8